MTADLLQLVKVVALLALLGLVFLLANLVLDRIKALVAITD